MSAGIAAREALRDRWLARWPDALAAWSRFTRLRTPSLCIDAEQAKQEGLAGSFAMIRLADQSVVVNLEDVIAYRLEDYAVEVLAHEIGHHVLAPANLTDHGRMLARMRVALPSVEQHAPMVANLYTDLFINDRLQRSADLRMADIYRRIVTGEKTGALWTLYMRIYEVLWRLERGSLAGETDDRIEGDAWLAARLVRSYAREHIQGSGRFAMLLLPYLIEDAQTQRVMEKVFDTRAAATGGEPSGLTEAEAGERAGAIHPADDPALTGEDGGDGTEHEGEGKGDGTSPLDTPSGQRSQGQARQPFEYGELLRAAGLALDDHEAAVRYYRERALPHLVPFPSRQTPHATDPIPEGLEPWDIGDPLDAVDWLETVLQSPRVIPGMTTVRRVWGTSEGHEPEREPLDLDLYVDSSGSMANPQRQISYPALAGAIVCLSALRAGSRVQATLWSGTKQFTKTSGFVRDEHAILRVLTGHFGGGTAFPIHILRDTYDKRGADARPAHIMIISDDGVTTMFAKDEKRNSGWDVSAMALAHARGGGTMVLDIPENWEKHAGAYPEIRRARDELGWQVHRIATWEDLVVFAREFSRLRYGDDANGAASPPPA